ncbi:probable pectinesterase 15 [Vicia villosa]|uniref:probable pectinesterase 15 n=1 Tax=Vicia villosa TaxID=3911 RepID=UPI00273AB0A4|nr:probable pectinesterase 15 [Vicia villosa]
MATNSPSPILKCDESKWTSQLISSYNVRLVLTVDSKGCRNFTSVQEAVNAVPDSSTQITLIILESGIYREKVKVNDTKTNLIIEGKGYLNTFIEWDDNGNRTRTFMSYSFGVFAAKFTAYNIGYNVDADKEDGGTSTSRKGAKVNNVLNKGTKKEALDAAQFKNLRSKLGVCIFEEP